MFISSIQKRLTGETTSRPVMIECATQLAIRVVRLEPPAKNDIKWALLIGVSVDESLRSCVQMADSYDMTW